MRRAMAALVALSLCSGAQAQVLFQHFYYPTPDYPLTDSWWLRARRELPELKKLGVWGLWHPVPVKGGSGAVSMGYDPYDLYDLGSKDQRGTVPTHFGSRDQYLCYVASAHASGLSVIADVVLNHTGGADRAETNPEMEKLGWDDIGDDSKVPSDHLPPGYDPKVQNLRSWTGFLPKGADGVKGTGRFSRNWRHFHPSPLHPDHNGPYHHPDFGSDYCFESDGGWVAKNMLRWSGWFQAQTGVDGYRLDAVKLIEPEFLSAFAAQTPRDFWLVGEFWDTNPQLLSDFQQRTQHRMKLFDFGLFYALKDLATKPDFDLRELLARRFADRERAATFVSNHDVDRYDPIPRERRALPYAVMMAMSGQPSIFYSDYFAPEDKALPETLRALTALHNGYARGRREIVRLSTRDALVIEREGGLLALFTRPTSQPMSLSVPTGWKNRTMLAPDGACGPLQTGADGSLTTTIPPRGYLLLIPRGVKPARLAPRAPQTTQTFEFDDDLDIGRLGSAPRTVHVTPAAKTRLTAMLKDLSGVGEASIEATDASGKTLARAAGRREKPVTLSLKTTDEGAIFLRAAAPGPPTAARLTITYTGPR